MEKTLRRIVLGNQIPKSGYVLLLILYIIANFMVQVVVKNQGTFVVFDRVVPYAGFAGVFTSLSSTCLMLLVLLYRKLGYVTAMLIVCLYQISVAVDHIFFVLLKIFVIYRLVNDNSVCILKILNADLLRCIFRIHFNNFI